MFVRDQINQVYLYRYLINRIVTKKLRQRSLCGLTRVLLADVFHTADCCVRVRLLRPLKLSYENGVARSRYYESDPWRHGHDYVVMSLDPSCHIC